MLVASFLLCLALQESIDPLLTSLGSDDSSHRGRAEQRLLSRWKEWTEDDLARLALAQISSDAEVSTRARELAWRIRLRRALGTPFLEEFPEIDRVFRSGTEEERLELLIQASAFCRRREWPDELVRTMALNAGPFPKAMASGRLLRVITEGKHGGLTPLLVPLALVGPVDRRRQALQRIQEFGSKEDVRLLLPCLADGHPQIRSDAAWAVATALRADAVPHLRPLLQDRAVSVRMTLLSWVSQQKIAALADDVVALLADREPECRRSAVHTLGELRLSVHAPALRPLLRDPDPGVRCGALDALAKMESKEHADAVVPLLQDPDGNIRRVAIRCLGAMEAIDHVDAVAVLLADPEPDTRGMAAYQLAEWKQRSRLKDILPLLQEDRTRQVAIEALRLLDSKEAAEPLMALAEDREERLPKDRGDRLLAIWAVGDLGAVEMAPRIAALGSHSDEEIRAAAFQALLHLGDAASAELMADHLLDGSSCEWAAQGLAMFGPRSLAPRIAQFVALESPIGEAAVTALGGIGGDDARKAILSVLTDPKNYSDDAVRSFARIGRAEDAAALFPLLAEDGSGAVALAVGELAAREETGREEAIRRLSTATSFGARIALARLGRKSAKEQVAMLQELLAPVKQAAPRTPAFERTEYGSDGTGLFRALELLHDPDAFARFEKQIVLKKPIESLDDLRDLLRESGFTVDLSDAAGWGRLPAGTRTTLRAICDWMLPGHYESEAIGEAWIHHERQIVLQGSTVKLLRLRRQVEYWQQRLDVEETD